MLLLAMTMNLVGFAHFSQNFCNKNLFTPTISTVKQKASVASETNHLEAYIINFKRFGKTGFEKSSS